MNNDIATLFSYPFEKGQIDKLSQDETGLFWNVPYANNLSDFTQYETLQHFKPYADIWNGYGIPVISDFEEDKLYQNIFCALPKQKEMALYMIAKSLKHLTDNCLLLCIAANDAGGKNIEKWMELMGLNPVSLSKSKCRIVWAYKDNILMDKVDEYIQKGSQQEVAVKGETFITKPGIYGWDKIDKGSQALVANLPDDIKGVGADFGTGYGYLSTQLLKQNKNIKTLHVLEADNEALLAAQENLKQFEGDIKIHYGWTDLSQPQENLRNLDFIIMNPPFHEGKATKHSIGQDFIVQASSCLRQKGCLYMVANSHLPYEKVLENNFSTVTKIYEENGYKIFMAQK